MKIKIQNLKQRVLRILDDQLDPALTYHNRAHTEEVMENCLRIAAEESVVDERKLFLLAVAALYHDTGFIYVYKDHEEKSCDFARKDLAGMDFSADEMEKICSMIMATKIPQSPQCHLEQIICDADLDYLGRADFLPISESLKKEFIGYGIVGSEAEWEEKQISFIQTHQYFTASSRSAREPVKQQHLSDLKTKAGLITN